MKLLRKGLLVLIAAALLLAFAACSEGGSDPDTTVYIEDFSDYTVGDTLSTMGWDDTPVAEIADNPVTAGNNVLKFTPNNYNAAPVISFTLAEGTNMADFASLDFKGYFAQGDVGWKDIYVYAFSTEPSGAFAQDTTTAIGSVNRASGASADWEDISIVITGDSAMTGTVYIAFGINCAATGDEGSTGATTIWYADDVELAK